MARELIAFLRNGLSIRLVFFKKRSEIPTKTDATALEAYRCNQFLMMMVMMMMRQTLVLHSQSIPPDNWCMYALAALRNNFLTNIYYDVR